MIEAENNSADIICATAPMGLLAELTHRCPLQCPYCSNPLELERSSGELATQDWVRVFKQAGELGILQAHLSGGEPTVRKDLEEITQAAVDAGIYTNLITAGVLLKRERLEKLVDIPMEPYEPTYPEEPYDPTYPDTPYDPTYPGDPNDPTDPGILTGGGCALAGCET